MKGKLKPRNGPWHKIGSGFHDKFKGGFFVMCDKMCECQEQAPKFRRFHLVGSDSKTVYSRGVQFDDGTVVTQGKSADEDLNTVTVLRNGNKWLANYTDGKSVTVKWLD